MEKKKKKPKTNLRQLDVKGCNFEKILNIPKVSIYSFSFTKKIRKKKQKLKKKI